MDSNQPKQEIKVIVRLMEFVQSSEPKGKDQPTLNFIFHTQGVGPYGKTESQWEANVHYGSYMTLDYGSTLEQAAERLLDRLLNPEKYQDED